MTKRYALISLNGTSADTIARYLPGEYQVVGYAIHENAIDESDYQGCFGPCAVIAGEDYCGWTLTDYVLPRLASGMIVGREIAADHPALMALDTAANVVDTSRPRSSHVGSEQES